MIGTSDTLLFELEWLPGGDDGLAWGHLRAFVGGELVWCSEDGAGRDVAVRWTWIDLLEHLASNWTHLRFEDVWPYGLTPERPNRRREATQKRWGPDVPVSVAESVFRFAYRHDLRAGLRGIRLPELFCLRQGNLAFVHSDSSFVAFPFARLISTLSALGAAIADRIRDSDQPRARAAVAAWDVREQDGEAAKIFRLGELRGLLPDELASANSSDFWELSLDGDSELAAVARLTASISDRQFMPSLLQEIRAVPRTETPRLDEFGLLAMQALGAAGFTAPYEEGYRIAQLLRESLGVAADKAVDPTAVLLSWGVDVRPLAMPAAIEAVAAWGPKHGPTVVYNPEGVRSRSPNALRATLAHEIGHLVLDRKGGLPLAEVLGGATPPRIEQRANGFAAELLAPRSAVAVIYGRTASISVALIEIQKTYEVSRHLAALQLRNGPAWSRFSATEKDAIRRAANQALGTFY